MKDPPRKNVTLSLPEPLLRRFRVYAATRNESMTHLMAEAIRKMVGEDREEKRKRLARELIESMRNAPDRGTGGVLPSREEMHDRVR